MQAVVGVQLEIVKIHERGLGEVVIGTVDVAHLGRDDRLGGRCERRIAHRERLVVVEVAPLLFGRERITAQVQGEHQVGLLDDLLAVQLEIGMVQEERVVAGGRVGEIPAFVIGEVAVLGVHTQLLVVGHVHGIGGRTPGGDLRCRDAQFRGDRAVALRRGGRRTQVGPCHQVGVDVVVGQGRVLVRSRHAIDVEALVGAVMAQRRPQTGGFDQQLDARLALERGVAGGRHAARHRRGHGSIDVERSGPGRPVGGALLAMDGAPRKRRTAQPELLRTIPGRR